MGKWVSQVTWVTWRVRADDPQRRALAVAQDQTTAALPDLVAAHGGVYEGCLADHELDGIPAYEWHLRVPRDQHRQGDPAAVTALLAFLRSTLPGLQGWVARPDRDASMDWARVQRLRQGYEDLLRPVEVALLGLRRHGAEHADPLIRTAPAPGRRAGRDRALAGDYSLWLGLDLDAAAAGAAPALEPPWLAVHVGVDTTGRLGGRATRRLRTHGLDPDGPLLLLPRPAGVPLVAALRSGPREPVHALGALAARTVTQADLRWAATDPAELAGRVAAAVRGLYPPFRDAR